MRNRPSRVGTGEATKRPIRDIAKQCYFYIDNRMTRPYISRNSGAASRRSTDRILRTNLAGRFAEGRLFDVLAYGAAEGGVPVAAPLSPRAKVLNLKDRMRCHDVVLGARAGGGRVGQVGEVGN